MDWASTSTPSDLECEAMGVVFAEELAAMEASEPCELEDIPLKLREAVLGPQRGSFVVVTFMDGREEVGKLEEIREGEVEVDLYSHYGVFPLVGFCSIRLRSTGALITGE